MVDEAARLALKTLQDPRAYIKTVAKRLATKEEAEQAQGREEVPPVYLPVEVTKGASAPGKYLDSLPDHGERSGVQKSPDGPRLIEKGRLL